MSWVTVLFSMMASACLTLAMICAFAWWRGRDTWAYLLFALAAVGTAATAGTDLAILRADSPARIAEAMRWSHPANWVVILALAGFIRVYLRAGRTWLLWTVCSLRTVSLILNYLTGVNLNYLEITRISHIRFLGESVSSIGEGVVNQWMIVGQLSVWLLLIFVIDAAIAVWRRGDRRQAVIVGGGTAFLILGGAGQAALIVWGHLQTPVTTSLFYVSLIFVMGYEIASEALRTKQLSRELRTSEQQMDLASSAAGLGLWSWDLTDRKGWASSKAYSLLGLPETEHLTQAEFMEAVHADDRELVRLAVERSMTNDRDFEVEHRVQMGHETRWVSERGRVECDAGGRPVLMRGVLFDISARRRSETELQRLQGQLAHTSRVSLLGQLVTALAHELHQPLGAILRNAEAAELFLDNVPPDLDELRAILADIRDDDRRAREVIDRLRGLLTRRSIELAALVLEKLLVGIAALTRTDAAERSITVEIEPVPGLPRIMGDGVHLQQVLLNLVLNAMDAIDSANTRRRLITIRALNVGADRVEVTVSDTGPGIPSGELARIFDPFVTTKPSGMGIGLSVSRTIIEAHGGRIWAENNATEGVTFRFTLRTEAAPA
jgi:two-component system, LuxR family, sensor kinase FixL